MDPDVAAHVVPYIAAVASAYGGAVLARIQDAASTVAVDSTVGLGSRLLRLILGRGEGTEAVRTAVGELAEDPADEDRAAALRVQLRKLFAADGELAAQVAGIIGQQNVAVTASGDHAVAVHTNLGVVSTGDDATIQR